MSVCDQCVSDPSTVLDCARVCGGKNVLIPNPDSDGGSDEICVNKDEQDNVRPCDDVLNSGAKLNQLSLIHI